MMTLKKFICLILCLVFVLLFGCDNTVNNVSFSANITEAMSKLNQNTNYNKYVAVTMKKPKILADPVTDEQGNINPNYNYVSENLIFKNIYDKKIKFNCIVFLSKELIASVAVAPVSLGLEKEITLDPGQSADIASAIIMKKVASLTDNEKLIFNNYSGKVYVELNINGTFYNFEQEPNSD